MANISKKDLNPNVESEIHDRFIRSVIRLIDTKSDKRFLQEFLTQTEQIMFAKRLSALFLLEQDVSSYRVARILSMSPTTTTKLARELDVGAHAGMRKIVLHEQKRKQFWKDLESLLRCGLPKRGRGRWKWFYEMYDAENSK